MLLFPAIDLFQHNAVRLYKGDYSNMTVYSTNPEQVALDFIKNGAKHIHIVDLEGAKNGLTPNFQTVCKIKEASNVFCQVGGGIRSLDIIDKYIYAGIDRVILGTAAVTNDTFLKQAACKYGDKIAVSVDIKDGFVAVNGWTIKSDINAFDFCRKIKALGISTLICTDISKDGAMQGTNRSLYEELKRGFDMNIIASGGVSSIDDIKFLRGLGLYGAIIGKAYYSGAVNLKEAVEVAE